MIGPLNERKVVTVGLACLDMLVLWQDVKKPVWENRASDFQVQGGGPAATASVAIARLGGRAELWTAIGAGWMGDMILRELADEGVDTSQVTRVEGARGPMVLVAVDQPTGDRRFVYGTGFSREARSDWPLERLDGAGCLLIDGMQQHGVAEVAQEAKRRGIPVVADMSAHVNEFWRHVLQFVDHAIMSRYCAHSLVADDDSWRACEIVREMGAKNAAVTLGERGVISLSDAGRLEQQAFKANVVDTTGAGDTFHGAFCAGLVGGLDLAENLRFSCAVAALKCRKLGGRAGIPTLAEAQTFLSGQSL